MANVRCVFAWALPVAAGFNCGEHAHDCTEIVFVRGGRGRLIQGEVAYDYGDGSIFVYQPGTRHWVENARPGEHLCLGVAGGRAEALPAGVWTATPALRKRFGEIRAALRVQDGLTQDRLDLLSGLAVCDLLPLLPKASTARLSRAQQVKAFIDGSLELELSLEELAKRAFVSPEYLRKLFRSEFGEPITHYVLRRRIELAGRLLLTTEDLVKEVAAQTGFRSEYYFSRAFRKMTGKSPQEYRREKRGA